jgi:cytochrome c peroxidase
MLIGVTIQATAARESCVTNLSHTLRSSRRRSPGSRLAREGQGRVAPYALSCKNAATITSFVPTLQNNNVKKNNSHRSLVAQFRLLAPRGATRGLSTIEIKQEKLGCAPCSGHIERNAVPTLTNRVRELPSWVLRDWRREVLFVGKSVLATLSVGLSVIYGVAYSQGGEPIAPLPVEFKLDSKKIDLGETLFQDKRLSRDNSVACSSCHRLSIGGTDGLAVSIGINGSKGKVNAPTVFNATFNFRQFWDGRAKSLEDQVSFPIHDALEMGSNWQEVIGKLRSDPATLARFKEVYADEVKEANIRDAIATYQRSLVTPNAKFDRYLRGERYALNAQEQDGYRLFKGYGCVACHQGMNVGGNMYQRFGVMGDYFRERGNVNNADYGRFNVTKQESDKFVFKVPSLRNVGVTAPYFHDGSAKTLEEAVAIMFKYQLGRSAPEKDKQLIVKFLHTLTGEYKGKPLSTPEVR